MKTARERAGEILNALLDTNLGPGSARAHSIALACMNTPFPGEGQ